MKNILLILFLFIVNLATAQINVNSLPFTYTQNFGTTDITGWTDNTAIAGGGFLGWYNRTSSGGAADFQSHQNITNAAPSNYGGFYSYECNGNNDQKIGSRASGGSGFVEYAVRFSNTSGSTINSYSLDFDWFQMSLAGNGNVANTIQMGSRVSGSAITALNTGVYGVIGSFTLPRDTSSTSSGAQFKGFPCTVSGHVSICVDDVISNGKDIMIKWQDINDANNDHHSAIDNVVVTFRTGACSTLPIELLSFTGEANGETNILKWITATEINNDFFTIERSEDAINFIELGRVNGAGNSLSLKRYSMVDTKPYANITYYKLIQTDFNGQFKPSEIIAVTRMSNDKDLKVIGIYNMMGQEVTEDYDGIKVYYFSNGSVIKKYKIIER